MTEDQNYNHLGFSTTDLMKLARWKMPFGKYAGNVLIDLPEEYLFWFQKKGFPSGELGQLLKFCLDLKIEGLDSVVKPLKLNSKKEKKVGAFKYNDDEAL